MVAGYHGHGYYDTVGVVRLWSDLKVLPRTSYPLWDNKAISRE